MVVALGLAARVAVGVGAVGVAVGVGVTGVAVAVGVPPWVAVGDGLAADVGAAGPAWAADWSSGLGPSRRTRVLPVSATTNSLSPSPVAVTPCGPASSVWSAHWPSPLKPLAGDPWVGQSVGVDQPAQVDHEAVGGYVGAHEVVAAIGEEHGAVGPHRQARGVVDLDLSSRQQVAQTVDACRCSRWCRSRPPASPARRPAPPRVSAAPWPGSSWMSRQPTASCHVLDVPKMFCITSWKPVGSVS